MKRRARNLLVAILLLLPILIISLTYLEDVTEIGGGGRIIFFMSSLPRHLVNLAAAAGYAGIFILMLLEAAAFPVPSEIILPLAGYLVSQGKLEFWPTVLCSTVAALLGSFVDYFLGSRLGRSLLVGHSRLPYLDVSNLRRAQVWFDKHGPIAVALLRLVPAARVLISFPAGMYRMDKWKFAAYTLLGCVPWNIMLVSLGWWLGSSWERVVAAFKYVNLAAYALITIFLVWAALRLTSRESSKGRP